MGESYRRLISIPADISTADTAALAERLAQNVRLQRELAGQSPHVLQFTSDLQTDEGGFYIEHEPAIVHRVPIFTPDAAVAEAEDLLRWAVALADSLRAAHAHPSRVVHGGLCPGVIVTTPEGVQKITDFGFAPSICATLGVDSFVNLRVEDRAGEPGDVKETGVWQIISPDVEHNDRICGFVDPQKYGNQTLHTFEPVSDIIGAGFLLHLMAENRHPYLHDNQDLLLPELAEAMAFFFYDGSRRKSLQNSSDERITVWCEIVAKMLEHLPDDRPDAATITKQLAEVGVEPHSLGDAQIRELDALAVFITEEKYEDARDRARTLAGGAATEEITERAKSLLRSAEAGLKLAKASEVLDTVDWRKARNELDAVDRDGLRPELVQKAADVESALKGLTEIDDRLTALESSFGQIAAEKPTTGDEAKRLHSDLDDLLARLTKLSAEIELPTPFLGRSDTLRSELDARLGAAQQTIAAIDADHSAAREWFADLQKAEKDDQRERVLELLAGRQDLSIAHWPDEVIAAAEATARRIEEIAQAESWMTRFATAVQDAETDHTNLEAAQACFAEKPRISEWPPRLREELDSLARRLAEVESISADRAKAGQWLERILQAVASEDWAAANRELTSKPSLRHWTDDAIAEEARLKPLVESHLEEQERIEVWLQSAKNAGDAEDFVTALGILDSPPASEEKIPKSARKQIAKWHKEFEARLAEARDRALKERSEVIRDKVRNLVGQIVESDFSRFLSAETIETTVDPVEWDSEDMASAGHGDLTVHVQFRGRNEPTPSIREDVQFRLYEGLPQILNDQSLRDRLAAELRRVVHEHQTHTATRLAEPLRQGLFPEATVETSIVEMSEKTTAKVSFLGPKAGSTSMETALVWDAKRADWAFADPESVSKRAVDIAASSLRELLKPKLMETSDLLRQYSSVLQADATAPPPPSPPAIPRSLTLEGRLTIHLDDGESAPLMTFPVSCTRAGEVSISADLGPAEAKLNEIIVTRQRTAQASVIQHLEERLTGAAVRCKLTPLVKRIKTPVEEVGFLLKPKRGDKVTVMANWNRDRFLFELGEQSEAELIAVLNGSAAAMDPAVPKADSAKAVTTSTGKRPAVAIVGVVIFLAMAGAAYMFWPQAGGVTESGLLVDATTSSPNDNSSPITLPANDNTTDNGPALVVNSNTDDTTVDPIPNDNTGAPAVTTVSASAAIETIKETLANSAYLRDLVSELVDTEATVENGVASVGYRVPGLQPVDRQVRLVASNDVWSIGLDGVQPVVQSQQDLTSLLDADRSDQFKDVVHGVVNRKLGQFVAPAAVSVTGIIPSWELDESHTFWVARGETATITINNIETATIPGLSFTARDDSVLLESTGDLGDHIESELNDAIVAIQFSAVNSWLSGLENFPMPPGANMESDTDIGADPRLEIRVRFWGENLIARDYSATWDRDSLTFERPQEWNLSAGTFVRAADAINRLNDRDQPLEWVQQVPTIGMFREGDQSTANELHVLTTAPWADDADDLPEQLALRIPLDSTDTDIQMPQSWPLIVRYLDLFDHPMIVGPADPAIPSSTLWSGLPGELAALVNAGLATIQLDATFQGKIRLTDGDSPQLDTQLVLSWRPSPSYADMSTDAVTAGLDDLTGGQALSYGFSLTLDEQGQALPQWLANHTVEDAATVLQAIPVYDRLLESFSERSAVEATLDTFFSQGTPAASGTGVKLSETEAFHHLEAIWNVKSIPKLQANIGDFPTLSRMIQAKKLFIRNRVQGPDYAVPTVFVEYFFGPRYAFAIVWSMAEHGVTMEKPSLIRLGAVTDVLDGQQTAALMFESVLAAVPKGVAAKRFTQFAGVLGLVLAMDDAPKTLSADLDSLSMASTTTGLWPLDFSARRGFPGEEKWRTLADLRGFDMRGDYKFVPALIRPDMSWQREVGTAIRQQAARAQTAFELAVAREYSGS